MPSGADEGESSQQDDFLYSSQADLATLKSQEGSTQAEDSEDERDVPNPDIIFHPSQAQEIEIIDAEETVELAEDKMKEYVGNVMRYVFFCNSSKRKCLTSKIKEIALRGEVRQVKISAISLALRSFYRSKQTFKTIMNEAKAGLKDLFGYSLAPQSFVTEVEKVGQVEIKSKSKGKGSKKAKTDDKKAEKQISSSDCWFLTTNNMSDATKLKLSERRSDNAKRGLLMVILSLVLLSVG